MYKFFVVDTKTKRARNADPRGAVRAAEEEEIKRRGGFRR